MITSIILAVGASCFGWSLGDGTTVYLCISKQITTPIVVTVTVAPVPEPIPATLDRRYLVQP